MKRPAIFLALSLLASGVWAEVEFLGLDIGKDDNLLFAARTGLPGDGSFDSLFSADLAKGDIEQLTIYPEHISLVDGGRRLQVQNRFGLYRTDLGFSNMAPVAGYPAFARGASVPTGRILPSEASPDGSYVLSAEPTSAAYCRLTLFNASSGTTTTVAEDLEYSIEVFPARWSFDSRHFIYAKRGSIYYFSIEQLIGKRVLDEDYRRLGEGRIGSIRWSGDGSLYYLRGSSLFRILPAEFFTQALYRGVAGMGVLAGIMPFPYDPNFDDYWVASDGTRIILSKGGRSLFLIYLNPDDFDQVERVAALPHLYLQGGTTVHDVLWPSGGTVTVFTGSILGGENSSGAFRFDAPSDPGDLDLVPAVKELDAEGAKELVLSPDGTMIAIVRDSGVIVRSYDDWVVKKEIAAPGTLHALWLDGQRLVVAGSWRIELVDIEPETRRLVALSQATVFGRDAENRIVARSGESTFALPAPPPQTSALGNTMIAGKAVPRAGLWVEAKEFAPKPAEASSTNYRVYLEASSSGAYLNTVMIRAVKALGTRSLFPGPAMKYAAFPDREELLASNAFDHGSRIRRREVALTFDALDSNEGLVHTLNVLSDYKVKASIFVNGEFIQRNPGAARLLAQSGHEIGSMFFTTVDPTDARFGVDRDYIRRGLARTEDDWFAATGKELSLIWHTPYYAMNSDILEAGASMSYIYVGRDMDTLDWVCKTDAFRLPGYYLPSHDIVERVISSVKPGSVIPVRLGVPDNGRDDYLFSELALLIDALEGAGYSIVPVSTLIEHAK